MNDLIKLNEVNIGDESVQTVNARELHAFLESKRKFSDWIKAKLDRLRLQENKDFCTASQICDTANGGYAERLDYFITLDTAKHIAMMENTDRGFEVRDYFIQCEKQLKSNQQTLSPEEGKMRALSFVISQTSLSDVAKETLFITTAENALGLSINYRPKLERKTYTATQIGEQLGISSNKVGKLANAHNLKTEEYGMYVLDKARGHEKQVENFRYYDNVIPVLKSILESKVNI